MVLYRKYRPQKFEELVGQDNIKTSILESLSSGKISHAYLFSGPRGVGKTSLARILGKAVNCKAQRAKRKGQSDSKHLALSPKPAFGVEPCDQCDSCLAVLSGTHLDLIEIDAASNRGIDDIRELREKIKMAPVYSRYKIYIIDEVHMLTTEAFNALLKTLEEPPEHAIFILATTSSEKIPATILSRCTQFHFRRATTDNIKRALEKVAALEKIRVDESALGQIAKAADGSYRDGLTILDALASKANKISISDVQQVLFQPQASQAYELIESLSVGKIQKSIQIINNVVEDGKDIIKFANNVIELLRAVLFIKSEASDFIKDEIGDELYNKLEKLAKYWSIIRINFAIKTFVAALSEVKFSPIIQLPFELAMVLIASDENINIDSKTYQNNQEVDKVDDKEPITTVTKQQDNKKDQPINNKTDNNTNLSQSAWHKILKEVKNHSLSVESMLRLARPVKFSNETLILEVQYRFHKERIESPSTYNLITQSIEKILSQKIKVKCVIGEKKNQNQVEDLEANISEIFAS